MGGSPFWREVSLGAAARAPAAGGGRRPWPACRVAPLPAPRGRAGANLKARGACRLLDSEQASAARLLAPHCQRTRARAFSLCTRQPGGASPLIEDTTTLDFSAHGACAGPVGRILLAAANGGAPPAAAGWRAPSALMASARLGGFLARRGDGPPRWQTLWRGWQRLMAMSEGAVWLNHHLQQSCR